MIRVENEAKKLFIRFLLRLRRVKSLVFLALLAQVKQP